MSYSLNTTVLKPLSKEKPKNAVILCEVEGTLYDVRRMEVHENAAPIIGFKGHSAHRLVLKTKKPSSIILPDKLKEDY